MGAAKRSDSLSAALDDICDAPRPGLGNSPLDDDTSERFYVAALRHGGLRVGSENTRVPQR
jgi:hypothetical protein